MMVFSAIRKTQLPVAAITTALFVVALLLTGCSQTRELNPFKDEYKSYPHSKYVKDNLKVSSSHTAANSATNQTKNNNNKKKASHQTVQQRQLNVKRSRSTAQIINTIRQNPLFTPSAELQQQVKGLKTTSADENWLNRHNSLSAILTMVLKNNLDIQSRHQEAQASLARYDQVSFLDDTLAQYAAFTKDLAVSVGSKKHSKPVTGGFPFPGLRSLKASIIDESVESSRLQLKQTVQDVITQTRIAYYELQLAQQESSIIANKVELLKSLKNQLKESYSTNTIELGNILEVDIEVEKNLNQLHITKNKRFSRQATLNALLNLPATFRFVRIEKLIPVRVTGTSTELLQKGSRNRVEIARLQSEIKKMERIIQLSEKRFYPDFSAGYSRFQNQTSKQTGSNASKDTFSTRPSFKPRNFFGTNDAYLTETRAKYKALQLKLSALQKKTEDDIQQAYFNYQTQEKTHRLYRSKVIPQSKTTLDIAKNLFETGDASYLKVIDIQKMILDYRLLSLNAVKELNVNAAKLSRFVGQSL